MGTGGLKVIRHRGDFFLWRRHSHGYVGYPGLGMEMYKMIPKKVTALQKWARQLRKQLDAIRTTYYKMLKIAEIKQTVMLIDGEYVEISDNDEFAKEFEIYEIDLDNMLFGYQRYPVYHLDNMPPKGIFIRNCHANDDNLEFQYGLFRDDTPEKYRFDLSRLKAPVIKNKQLATYRRHFTDMVTEPHDILSLRQGLTRAEDLCLRVLGHYVDLYVYKNLFIMYHEIALVLDKWLTPGMEILTRLGHLHAADDVEFFYSNLSSRWWVHRYWKEKEGKDGSANPPILSLNRPRLPFEILSMIAHEFTRPDDLFSFALASTSTMAAAIPRMRFPQMRGQSVCFPYYYEWGYGGVQFEHAEVGHILDDCVDKTYPTEFKIRHHGHPALLQIQMKEELEHVMDRRDALRFCSSYDMTMPRASFTFYDTSGDHSQEPRFKGVLLVHDFLAITPREACNRNIWPRFRFQPHVELALITYWAPEFVKELEEAFGRPDIIVGDNTGSTVQDGGDPEPNGADAEGTGDAGGNDDGDGGDNEDGDDEEDEEDEDPDEDSSESENEDDDGGEDGDGDDSEDEDGEGEGQEDEDEDEED